MRNCFLQQLPDGPPYIGIADLTNIGEMVPGSMTITRINIPAAYRGQGYGTQLLRSITQAADEAGVDLSLEIMPSGPLDYDDLEAWYKRHGFTQIGDNIYYRKHKG